LAAAPTGAFGLTANSHQEKQQRAEQKQATYARAMAKGLLPVVLLCPATIVALSIVALARDRTFWKSLTVAVGLLVLAALVLWLAPAPDWIDTPLDKLGYYFGEFLGVFDGATLICLPLMGLAGLVGLAALIWRAIKEPDRPLGLKVLLWVVYLFLLAPLVLALIIADWMPPDSSVIAFLIGYLLVPFAFLLRAVGFGFRGQRGLLLAGLAVTGLTLFGGTLPVFVAAGPFVGQAFGGDAMVNRMVGARRFAVEEAMLVPAAMPTVIVEKEVQMTADTASGAAPAAEAPRLRQFFPETLFWLPEAETDTDGGLSLEIPMADSITTWRLSALASTQDGRLGAAAYGLRVFQDFFVDIDLPVSLTQNDEVSMPVAVHNYLKQGQRVTLTLEEADWFEILDEPGKELFIEANDVEVVYFRVRVTAVSGRYRPKVMAIGERTSDYTTSTHDVIVYPDGKRFEYSVSDRLQGSVTEVISIPAEAINGTAKITVKIYPGIVSQVVEGLEKILRMPFG